MKKLEWYRAVEIMKKNLVKVTTYGDGYGSGVLVHVPANPEGMCCVLTANHVIGNAKITGATIEIELESTHEKIILLPTERMLFPGQNLDQALIIFRSNKKLGAIDEYSLMETNTHLKPGVEVGWLGYPRIVNNAACFLSGYVSAYLPDSEAYLVDGASIHGISGGPVFCREDEKVTLVGIVTAYRPNQVHIKNIGIQALPGLSKFQTIDPLMKLYEATNPAPKLPTVIPDVK